MKRLLFLTLTILGISLSATHVAAQSLAGGLRLAPELAFTLDAAPLVLHGTIAQAEVAPPTSAEPASATPPAPAQPASVVPPGSQAASGSPSASAAQAASAAPPASPARAQPSARPASAHDGHADPVRHLRRSRAMLAAGAGLLVSGLAGVAIGATKSECDYTDRDERNAGLAAVAGVVGGFGLVLSVSGIARLSGSDRSLGKPAGWLPALALGTAAAGLTVWGLAGLPHAINCAST